MCSYANGIGGEIGGEAGAEGKCEVKEEEWKGNGEAEFSGEYRTDVNGS